MKKIFNQSGIIHALPLLVIVAAVGIISYLLITSAAPFKGGLLGDLNPKSASQAAASPTGQRLRALAGNFLIGYASVSGFDSLPDVATYKSVAASEFNILTPENDMKWATTEPQQNVFNFGPGDTHVQFALANGMKVHGHNLAWGSSNPGWLASGSWTANTLTQVLYNHIDNVVGHYKGQVAIWDVVNEPINTPNIWQNVIGPSYIDLALRRAHAADPAACLIINEYSDEQLGGAGDALYSMAQGLKQSGSPLCGVGFQMHLVFGPTDLNSFSANMQRFADLGLQIYITEMDVSISPTPSQSELDYQAQTYQGVLDRCLLQSACKGLQMWGFTDKYSWIPGFFSGKGAALIFDDNYNPKSAYFAMQSRLSSLNPTPTPSPTPTSYNTSFPLTENPISEGGKWLNGKTDGLDFQDAWTTPGKVFGTQGGSSTIRYDDSIAVLKGTYGPDQEASATVFNNNSGGDWNAEVELHLRSAISAHNATGYEIEYSVTSNSYCDIVRWNGAVTNFTPLLHVSSGCSVKTGDVVRATMIGNLITAYINGVQVMQTTDNTFTSGNPGVGFYLNNHSQVGNSSNYGLSSYSAKTISGSTSSPSPTPTSIPTSTPNPTPTPSPGVEAVFNGPHNLPGTLQVEDYDNGGEGLAYHDLDAANQGGGYRTSEGVDVQATTDPGGGFNIGWTGAGEWMKYMVNVTSSGTYNLGFRVASQGAGGTFHLEVDGVNVTGAMTVPDTTNWQTFTTLNKTGVSISSGVHVIRLVMDTNSSAGFIGNFNWISFGQSASPTPSPSLTPIPTPSAMPSCPKGSLGDIDCDNVIGIFDYNIIVTNFGKSGTGIQGDIDLNGTINIFDYNIIVTNFGK